MAWLFSDSFDPYAAIADMATHWDAVGTQMTLQPGRFAGSQGLRITTTAGVMLTRASGSNDATHHLVFSLNQTAALAGTTLVWYLQLLDGTNGQCCVVFRSDGTILLTSGTPGGTVLATYSSAFASGVWNGYEIEITIHNTAGAIHIRKNGALVDDFSATGLNTRPVSANNYANKLQIGFQTNSAPFQILDDLLWFNTSGAAPNSWVGDIRSCQLLPSSDASVQFAKVVPTTSVASSIAVSGTLSNTANIVRFRAVTANFTGIVASMFVNLSAGATGNLRLAIYDALGSGGGPGTLLGSSAAITNPVTGIATALVSGGPLVTSGVAYWLAVLSDATFSIFGSSVASGMDTLSQTYGSGFPSSAAGFAVTTSGGGGIGMNVAPATNAQAVADVTQDGLTSYVYDSTVGHADFYDLSDLPFVPVSIIGLVTRGYVEKSDAGLRQMQLQLKSGAVTVQSTTLTLATSFVYTSRVDVTDPNTSAAWTAAAVNAVQVGPIVTA